MIHKNCLIGWIDNQIEKAEKEAKNVCVVDKELLDQERLGAKGPLDEILKKIFLEGSNGVD